MQLLKVGDKVQHKKARRIAFVEGVMNNIEGGIQLDREIDGFYTWKSDDLILLPCKKILRRRGPYKLVSARTKKTAAGK